MRVRSGRRATRMTAGQGAGGATRPNRFTPEEPHCRRGEAFEVRSFWESYPFELQQGERDLGCDARSRYVYIEWIAVCTPSSVRILSPTYAAFSFIILLVVAWTSASAISCSRSAETLKPAPNFCTRDAQKNWSPNQGLMMVGIPALRLAPVVPAPPWWNAASILGNSQSCGTLSNE